MYFRARVSSFKEGPQENLSWSHIFSYDEQLRRQSSFFKLSVKCNKIGITEGQCQRLKSNLFSLTFKKMIPLQLKPYHLTNMGYFGKEGMQSNAASLLKKQNVVVNLTKECTQDISIGYPFSYYCFIHTSSLLHKKEDQEIPDMLNLLFITTTTTFKDSTIRTIKLKMAKSRLVNR